MRNGGQRSSVFGVARGLLVVAGLASLAGCDSGNDSGGSAGSAAAAVRRSATPEECRNMVDNALAAAEPRRLGVTSDAAAITTLLNQWRGECGAADAAAATDQRAVVERLFAEGAREDILSERFPSHDAEQLRDAILFRRVARHIGRNAGDLERAVELFGWVARNVQLLADDATLPATTPFHAVLFGQGRAEDRAWIFAELLRQAQLDAVIVRLPNDSPDAGGDWLVGVPIDGKLSLFDVRLGIPVPSGDAAEGPFITRPATFDEVIANPELLDASWRRRGGTDAASARLAETRIELIGTPSLWAPRMEALQASLTGERFVVIHQPLAGAADAPGLPERLAGLAGAAWRAEEIGVWPWSMRQWSSAENSDALSDTARAALEKRLRHFDAPYTVLSGHGDVGFTFGWGHEHRDARLKHLAGDYDEAAADYLRRRVFRTSFPVNVPQTAEMTDAHDAAAEDSYFWISVALLEKARDPRIDHEARTAGLSETIGNLRGYLDAPSASRWTDHARLLFAEALAMQGDLAGAIAVLEAIPADVPQHAEGAARLARWRTLSDARPMR
ncbi:MAG: hypothetical protein WD066_14050 [Planctomycetaceae bacterium]